MKKCEIAVDDRALSFDISLNTDVRDVGLQSKESEADGEVLTLKCFSQDHLDSWLSIFVSASTGGEYRNPIALISKL